jgi:NitT/TauT family transport system permease protein
VSRYFERRVLIMQVALFACTILLWEVAARHRWANPMFIGQPSVILRLATESLLGGTLLRAAGVTLAETLSGFAGGMIVGSALGLALWWSRLAGRVLEPLLVIFNAVPKIALAPIFIVLLGLGFSMKLALAFTNVVVLATLAAYTGAKQADPDLMDLIRSVGGSRWRVFALVVLPTSVMWIVSTLEIGLGLAFVGAVTGEFLASREGLGYLALYGSNVFNMNLIWIAVLSMMFVTVIMAWAVRRLERRVLDWRPQPTSI